MAKRFKQVLDDTVWIVLLIGVPLILVIFGIILYSNKSEVEEVINSPDYGIVTSHFPENVSYSQTVVAEKTIDCRKLSSSFRTEKQKQGFDCYGIQIIIGENRRMVILTGSGIDPSIAHDDKIQLYSDQIMYNLPLERYRVDNFPVNFHGTKVSDDDVEDYSYYSGLIYKGPNTYSITFEGYFDNDVKALLDILDFE